jgi:BTB/POZ domain
VGGKIFATSIQTLQSQKGSLFDAMFSGRWEVSDNTIFFDRNPKVFEFILDFLRGEPIAYHLLSPLQLALLRKDAEYYQLDALVNTLIALQACYFSQELKSATITNVGEDTVELGTTAHSFVLGKPQWNEGAHKITLKVVHAGHWLFFGVVSTTPTTNNSYSHSDSYGWAGSSQVYVAGALKEGFDGFVYDVVTDDVVVLTLDCNKDMLTYKNETKGGRTYTLTLPTGKAWRLHLNLYNTGDKIQIIN